MKFMTNFAIFGLLLMLLSVNQIDSRKIISKTSEALKNESSVVRAGIDTLKTNAKDLNSNANIDLFIKLSLEMATKLAPLPLRPLFGLAASIFSAYYNNSKNANSNVTQEQLSREIKEVGSRISIESQRVIDEIKRAIVEHRLKQDLQETLDSLDQDWDIYSRCFLSDDCPDEVYTDAFNQTLVPSSHFRKKLTSFVRKFINQKTNEHSVVYPRDGFFKFALEDCEKLVKDGKDCDGRHGQAIIYQHFMTIMVTISRSYSMVILANMIRYRGYINSNQADKARKQLIETMETIKMLNRDVTTIVGDTNSALAHTKNLIRRCNPEKPKKYETFDYFRHLYGGYFGKAIEDDGSASTSEARQDRWSHHLGSCGRSRYYFHMLDCSRVSKYTTLVVSYDVNDAERFCSSVSVGDKIYGQKDFGDKVLKSEELGLYNWNPSNKWYLCYSEFPIRDSSGPKKNQWLRGQYAQRYVSLAAVEASPDHAITGIRWKFIDGMLFLEIQQGEFIDGRVNHTTVHWKPTIIPDKIDNFPNVTLGHFYGKALGFNLDNVILPAGYYLTGIKFDFNHTASNSENITEKLIQMKIQGHQLNGNSSKSDWISMNSWPKNTVELPLAGSDVSEKAPSNKVLSESGQHYVILQSTDMEKDLAQTTIPYIDIQPIETEPAQPLIGIGMYYKGFQSLGGGFGGYIGLQAFHRNYTDIISPKIMSHYSDKIDHLFERLKNRNAAIEDLEDLWKEIQ